MNLLLFQGGYAAVMQEVFEKVFGTFWRGLQKGIPLHFVVCREEGPLVALTSKFLDTDDVFLLLWAVPSSQQGPHVNDPHNGPKTVSFTPSFTGVFYPTVLRLCLVGGRSSQNSLSAADRGFSNWQQEWSKQHQDWCCREAEWVKRPTSYPLFGQPNNHPTPLRFDLEVFLGGETLGYWGFDLQPDHQDWCFFSLAGFSSDSGCFLCMFVRCMTWTIFFVCFLQKYPSLVHIAFVSLITFTAAGLLCHSAAVRPLKSKRFRACAPWYSEISKEPGEQKENHSVWCFGLLFTSSIPLWLGSFCWFSAWQVHPTSRNTDAASQAPTMAELVPLRPPNMIVPGMLTVRSAVWVSGKGVEICGLFCLMF